MYVKSSAHLKIGKKIAMIFSLLFLAPELSQASPLEGLVSGEQRQGDDLASARISRTIVLEPAGQLVLPARGIRSYSEGTRGIIDVRLTKNGEHFVLVGQNIGETTLLFLRDDGSEEYVLVRVQENKREELDEVKVERNENIRLDFYFVQFDRARSHQIGLGYAESISMGSFSAEFDFLSQSFQSASALVENQALMRLDMAEAQGHARLLRKAALITENGKLAEFTGGGEVNIPVQGSLTTGIHKISFGSTIKVLPYFDPESHRMLIELSAEVADLTDDRGSGAPGRLRSTLTTVVNLAQGQAIALAGLSAQNDLRSRKGLPLLSRIPILGALFGSQRLSQQQTDLVIFILPTVVEQAQFARRQEIGEALESYRNYRGKKDSHEKLLQHFHFIESNESKKQGATPSKLTPHQESMNKVREKKSITGDHANSPNLSGNESAASQKRDNWKPLRSSKGHNEK